ncbi:MAG: hypothetical protein HKN33_13890 [Pyrinomonadaceae bacterium]|nr:hypothetical protein [Pyrinomonadaceae bacterium]
MADFESEYTHIRDGGRSFYAQKRGLIEVWGSEAIQFLNGLITNDIEALQDGAEMKAAFPNAKGRLLAVVRVLRKADRYFFETEEATYETVYENLFRFTMAGDFKVEDRSSDFTFVSLWNTDELEHEQDVLSFGRDVFVPNEQFEAFRANLLALPISESVYETIRIEEGIPLYGKDMDETTVVPETNIEGLVHYQKGCYIGQEVIARIHFLGKPAKLLKGLEFKGEVEIGSDELLNDEGKGAGKITSVVYSPKLEKTIAFGYVRNAFSKEGTELIAGELSCKVKDLPFLD